MDAQQGMAAEVRSRVAALRWGAADAARAFGLSESTYWRYFVADGDERRSPDWPTVVRIADALGMAAAELAAAAEARIGVAAPIPLARKRADLPGARAAQQRGRDDRPDHSGS